jgi:excisionase family DNA binding protein
MSTNATYLQTKQEAARYLGVSEDSIERLMRSGLAFVKVGNGHTGSVRFRPEDLADFVQRRTQRPGADGSVAA